MTVCVHCLGRRMPRRRAMCLTLRSGLILGKDEAGFYVKRLIRKVLATVCAVEVRRCGPKATDPAKRRLTEIALFDASDSPCRFAA
jgi:hypothetical protein